MNKGQFAKGHSGYWKGKKLTKEAKEKMSQARIGHKSYLPEDFVPWNKGKNIKTNTGATHFKKGDAPWNKGKNCPQFQGANGGGWKGGVTVLYDQIRNSMQMRQWKSDVYSRDKFTCQHCGDNRGGNLNAHHIEYFSAILNKYSIKTIDDANLCEALWNINNGLTLCKKCHIAIHLPREAVA